MIADALRQDHPTGMVFIDESGSIAKDRFFSVGCLKLEEPSDLTRALQKLRDKEHWYKEIHFFDLTEGALPFYRKVVDAVADIRACSFSCFVADRQSADPVARFGNAWSAYEKLATQLILGTIRRREIVTVLADNYSTPDEVNFERDLKTKVNQRLGRLAVTAVCRLDSRASDALQVVDLLTSAATFEFRQAAGLAGSKSPKARLAGHVRKRLGITSGAGGFRNERVNIAIYKDGA